MKIISVTDRKNCIRPLEEQVELICKAGVDMVVLREKDMPPEDYLALADSIRRICARYETEFCINGFTDIARDLGVGTVWVSFPSITESGRLDFPKVGVSVHSVGIYHQFKMLSLLLEFIHQQKRILEVDIVVTRSVSQPQRHPSISLTYFRQQARS